MKKIKFITLWVGVWLIKKANVRLMVTIPRSAVVRRVKRFNYFKEKKLVIIQTY